MNAPSCIKIFKSKVLLVFTILTTLIAGCTGDSKMAQDEMSEAELIAEAEKLDSLFLVAFNSGDAEAMMNLYWNSPDLRAYYPMDMKLDGYNAIKASYVRDFTSSKGAIMEYLEVKNIPFKNGVVGHGTFRITMPMEGSDPMVFDGRFTEVKAMRDGKMVVVLDHASMPLPPPPPDSTLTQ